MNARVQRECFFPMQSDLSIANICSNGSILQWRAWDGMYDNIFYRAYNQPRTWQRYSTPPKYTRWKAISFDVLPISIRCVCWQYIGDLLGHRATIWIKIYSLSQSLQRQAYIFKCHSMVEIRTTKYHFRYVT